MKKIFLFSLSLALPLLCGCANDKLANGCKVTDFDDEKVTMDYIDFLTDYEGYLDNVEVLDDIYAKQDYDQDQKPDRVLQYFMDDGEKMYALCFGNGKILEIGPFEDTMMQINLYASDLTGDGKNEIIFYGFHSYSDYPYENSEIAIWAPTRNKYKLLPITISQENDSYKAGYPVFIEKTDKEYEILITCEELGLAEKYQISKHDQKTFGDYYSDLQNGEKFLSSSTAWNISIEEGTPSTLTLYEDILYRLNTTLKIEMKWNGNQFEVLKTSILDERP